MNTTLKNVLGEAVEALTEGAEVASKWDKMSSDQRVAYGFKAVADAKERVNKVTRDYNVGKSDYAEHAIQPWDIWKDYSLNPWDADIVKRVLRTKEDTDRTEDYKKIMHICQERIDQLAEGHRDAVKKTQEVIEESLRGTAKVAEDALDVYKVDYADLGKFLKELTAVKDK